MKKQKNKGGLVLSREIVRILGDQELRAAVGGAATGLSVCHCPTFTTCTTNTTRPFSALC
jgi:hypothetical protein